MRIFLVAHHARLDLAVELLDVVCVLYRFAFSQGPHEELGVLIVVVGLVGPEHLDLTIVLYHFLCYESFVAVRDD